MKYIITLKNKTYEVEVERGEAMIVDEYEAKAPVAEVAPAAVPAAAPNPAAVQQSAPTSNASGIAVTAPLPGNVLAIKVAPGTVVTKGDLLILIEAMKMENEVLAPSDGVVKEICVTKGQVVSTGDVLAYI